MNRKAPCYEYVKYFRLTHEFKGILKKKKKRNYLKAIYFKLRVHLVKTNMQIGCWEVIQKKDHVEGRDSLY